MHQLEDNLKAANLTLFTSKIHQLDALTAPPSIYPGWLDASIGLTCFRLTLAEVMTITEIDLPMEKIAEFCDLNIVWDVVQSEIPPLIEELKLQIPPER